MAIDGGGRRKNQVGHPHRSESYHRWVNQVVERVTAEFPDVMFGITAYREVYEPSSVKLHPNVVVTLCMDYNALMDPEIRAAQEKIVRDWAKVAKLNAYCYNYGVIFYSLPRLFFKETQQMLQFIHKHGGVAAHDESYYTTVAEGPKNYVFYKLLEDPYRDLEATIVEWCEAAVGAKAAPYLRRYYRFWEDFWRTQAIHTRWWNGRHAQYLGLGHFGSYMYGLKQGDMARCRDLMEQMFAKAKAHGTNDQKKRARLLMAVFEWNEANAIASGGEIFSPNGTLPNAAAALALLRKLPQAQRAYETALRLPQEMETKGWIASSTVTRGMSDPVSRSLAAVGNWLSDSEVLAELKSLSGNPTIKGSSRFLASAIFKSASGEDVTANLLENSSFEHVDRAVGSGVFSNYGSRGTDGWETWSPRHGVVSRTDEMAASGTYSLKCELNHGSFRVLRIVQKARPKVQYYFSARVYIPKDQSVQEGRLNIRGSPAYRRDDQYFNCDHTKNIPDIVLTPGEWNYVSCTIPPSNRTEVLRLMIYFNNFEDGDVAYIDDVQVLEIADPKVE